MKLKLCGFSAIRMKHEYKSRQKETKMYKHVEQKKQNRPNWNENEPKPYILYITVGTQYRLIFQHLFHNASTQRGLTVF